MFEKLSQFLMLSPRTQIVPCDCPCDDLVDVENPKVAILALSHIAQAIVVTIVGFNMGFRFVGAPHDRGGGGVQTQA